MNPVTKIRKEITEATYAFKRAKWMQLTANRQRLMKHYRSLAFSAFNKVRARLLRAIKALQVLLAELALYRANKTLWRRHFNQKIQHQLRDYMHRLNGSNAAWT